MKRLLILVLAVMLLVPATAMARTATITWTPPDARTDGTPLTADEIAGYVFSCRLGDAPHVDLLDIAGAESSAVSTYADLFGETFGTYQCAMRTVDTTGLESALSNEVAVIHKAGPLAPGELKIEVEAPSVFSRISGFVSRVFR